MWENRDSTYRFRTLLKFLINHSSHLQYIHVPSLRALGFGIIKIQYDLINDHVQQHDSYIPLNIQGMIKNNSTMFMYISTMLSCVVFVVLNIIPSMIIIILFHTVGLILTLHPIHPIHPMPTLLVCNKRCNLSNTTPT